MRPFAALLLAFGLLAGGTAAAQDDGSKPASPASAPTGGGATKPDPQDVRARWKKMTPEERKRLQENFERWKKLPPEKKELLRQRFQKLEEARRSEESSLPEDDRKKIQKLRDPERRRELTNRALKKLRDDMERIPDEVRKDLREALRNVPPEKRAEVIRKVMQRAVHKRLGNRLERLVHDGKLSADDVAKLKSDLAAARGPEESLRILRAFIRAHPQAFPGAERIRDRVRERLRERKGETTPPEHPRRERAKGGATPAGDGKAPGAAPDKSDHRKI